MSSRISAAVTAAIVTLLSVSTLGVLFGGFDFFLLEWLERLAEAAGLVAAGWGHAHMTWLFAATAVTTVPPFLYFGVVLFRHSYRVELALADTGPDPDPPA